MNWNSLSYRYKNALLAAILLILILVSYPLAFQKTIQLYNENQYLADLQNSEKYSVSEFSILFSKFQYLDSIYQSIASQDYEKNMLSSLAELSTKRQLTVENVSRINTATRIDFIQMQGSFANETRFIKDIETTLHTAVIRSIELHVEHNRQQKKDQLLLDIYLEKLSVDE